LETKSIRWEDIKRIRKVRVTNGYNYVDNFRVVDRMPRGLICRFFVNLCGDIVFNHEISDLRGLLEQVNSFARQHNIPLFVWDTEAAGAKVRAKTGTEKWRQGIAEIEDVRVTEF